MYSDKSNRVIYNKDTGKIYAYITHIQNLEAVMKNFEDAEWMYIDPIKVPKINFATHVNLITKILIN